MGGAKFSLETCGVPIFVKLYLDIKHLPSRIYNYISTSKPDAHGILPRPAPLVVFL